MKSITQKLDQLGAMKASPSVTISLNTHRTHPDNEQDRIVLKKLLRSAEEKVLDAYDKKTAAGLLDNLQQLESEIDINYNLDSLHIFVSNDHREAIRSIWPVPEQSLFVGDHFKVRQLIKAATRMENYYILQLSEGGCHLYEALNGDIVAEVNDGEFPFETSPHYIANANRQSDSKQGDNMTKEYFNKVDKAAVRESNESGLPVVVIATGDNYSMLQQVADAPQIYIGHTAINYNATKPHELAAQAWAVVKETQQNRKMQAVSELSDSVGEGKVLTDLQEIHQAAIDGRGGLLIVNQEYSLPVTITGERTFELENKGDSGNAENDLVGIIAWNVRSKGGRVVFTQPGELDGLGEMALKVRY